MTANADGTGNCDRCGKALENTSVVYCVVISYLSEAGDAKVIHLCTSSPEICGSVVLDVKATDWLIKNRRTGKPIRIHDDKAPKAPPAKEIPPASPPAAETPTPVVNNAKDDVTPKPKGS